MQYFGIAKYHGIVISIVKYQSIAILIAKFHSIAVNVAKYQSIVILCNAIGPTPVVLHQLIPTLCTFPKPHIFRISIQFIFLHFGVLSMRIYTAINKMCDLLSNYVEVIPIINYILFNITLVLALLLFLLLELDNTQRSDNFFVYFIIKKLQLK